MKLSQLCLSALVAVLTLEIARADSIPTPHDEDMLRTLLELDRMYAAVGRPSSRSGPPISARPTYMEPKVQRAISMLRLQNLDKMYAAKSRPRFGKRGGEGVNLQRVDYEGQEYQGRDWFPVRR